MGGSNGEVPKGGGGVLKPKWQPFEKGKDGGSPFGDNPHPHSVRRAPLLGGKG